MRIAVLTETQENEKRVAVSPETVNAYVKKGLSVLIQAGAGKGAHIADEAFEGAGAKIVKSLGDFEEIDILLCVRRPKLSLIETLRKNVVIVGGIDPYSDRKGLEALAHCGASVFALEFMPRITRAQSMDILSSQANLAGYRAIIDAAALFNRAFPMMMTPAGTVPPAKIFIMGVGVAGLQAIATARRLGAIVTATDVRKATQEQVKSLGAKFIFADIDDAATEQGYARELSQADEEKQARLIADHVKLQDIIVTTALIPGRPAPILLSSAMIETMRPGSVIIDLAAERGGNTPLTKRDEIIEHRGVRIVGAVNLASQLAGNASPLFAKNLANFLEVVISPEGKLVIDEMDEIIKGTLIAKGGKLIHPHLNSQ